MIVRIFAAGTSFKGLSAYLTHDPDAETADRVAWTHTHNLANDHVPSAVDEMLWTARDAELLKQEAGIRAGGRATESPVKHVSLNWAPVDTPSREHMISTGESFLQKMGWQEHQAIFVAHSDKEHAHVHLVINAVHPETGLKLNEGFEQRRAQTWALNYEREQGRIDCEQRLKDPRERQDAPNREAWLAFRENQKTFERAEKIRQDAAENIPAPRADRRAIENGDWQILKDLQRDERLAHFAAGKAEFADMRAGIFQEIREAYRERWSELCAARRLGVDADSLADMKATLVAEQKATLAERRDAACGGLRDRRDTAYRDLLDQQNDTRLIFRERMAAGLDTAPLLQQLRDEQRALVAGGFSAAADEVTNRRPEPAERAAHAEPASARDSVGDLTVSAGMGLLSIGESLFATFIAAKPVPRTAQDIRETEDLFQAAARATTEREQREREDADEEWRKRQRSFAGD